MAITEAGIKKRSYLFSATQAGLGALQSAIILFVISRTQELETAGIITIGFALGNLMMIIARYGIHTYQVTDTNGQFSFSDYFYNRIFTVAGTLMIAILYLAVMTISRRYTMYKSLIIFEIILLKLIDAFEDLYVGRLQQKGRLDLGAGIATLRLAISTGVVFAFLWFVSLPTALLLGIFVSVALDCALISRTKEIANYTITKSSGIKIRGLMKIGLILCVGTTLHYYVGNTPKYLVDLFLDDRIQAIGGYIMMPVFMITLFNMFMVQPLVKSFGDAWKEHKRNQLRRMAGRHIGMILAVTVLVTVLGSLIGLKILSRIYQVDLDSWQREFTLLMIGGGLYTVSSFFVVLLTAVRKQHIILWGCFACFVVYLAAGRSAAENAGLYGLCLLYIAASSVMLCVFILGMVWKTKSKAEE